MKTTQYIGLTGEARKFVKSLTKVKSDNKIMGVSGESILLGVWKDSLGKQYEEAVQPVPWSSNHRVFTRLKVRDTFLYSWESDPSFMKAFGKFVFSFALNIVSLIARGYIISILWGWYVVPLFDAPLLTIPYAIGLMYVVSMLWDDFGRDLRDSLANKDEWWVRTKNRLGVFATYWAVLSIAWIVKLFM